MARVADRSRNFKVHKLHKNKCCMLELTVIVDIFIRSVFPFSLLSLYWYNSAIVFLFHQSPTTIALCHPHVSSWTPGFADARRAALYNASLSSQNLCHTLAYSSLFCFYISFSVVYYSIYLRDVYICFVFCFLFFVLCLSASFMSGVAPAFFSLYLWSIMRYIYYTGCLCICL